MSCTAPELPVLDMAGFLAAAALARVIINAVNDNSALDMFWIAPLLAVMLPPLYFLSRAYGDFKRNKRARLACCGLSPHSCVLQLLIRCGSSFDTRCDVL